jgi:hypothetical protein
MEFLEKHHEAMIPLQYLLLRTRETRMKALEVQSQKAGIPVDKFVD